MKPEPAAATLAASGKRATYCYQCVAGPDLLTVKVVDGVATEVEPNFAACDVHPGGGKVCVKAYGLVQKTYNPNRVLTPMRRTNPKKGRNEDPGFVPISWDEALDTIAAKLRSVREAGLLDASGYPKVAANFGGGGTPQSYMGTFPAFLAAWGPVDMGFGSGQGVKCTHSEHLYGEFWHRAFTVCPDTPDVQLRHFLRRQFGGLRRGGRGVAPRQRARARHEARADRAAFVDHRRVFGRVGSDKAQDRSRIPLCSDTCDAARIRARAAGPPVSEAAQQLALSGRRQRIFPARCGDEETAAVGLEQQCRGDLRQRPAAIRPSKATSPATRSRSARTKRFWRRAGSRAARPSPNWSSTCGRTPPNGRPKSATCPRRPCAASPTSTSITPRSGRRYRSKARPCLTARCR